MGRPRSSEFGRELVAGKGEGKRFIDGSGGEFGWEESGKRRSRRGGENDSVLLIIFVYFWLLYPK